MSIKVDNLTSEVMKIMNEYVGATEQDCEIGVKLTAKAAAKKLRSAHPPGSGVYRSWNEYDSGWTVKDERKSRKNPMSIVHNKTHYRLTHLLEKGHALVNGGRTRAFPHIAPVAEEAERELIENIRKEING